MSQVQPTTPVWERINTTKAQQETWQNSSPRARQTIRNPCIWRPSTKATQGQQLYTQPPKASTTKFISLALIHYLTCSWQPPAPILCLSQNTFIENKALLSFFWPIYTAYASSMMLAQCCNEVWKFMCCLLGCMCMNGGSILTVGSFVEARDYQHLQYRGVALIKLNSVAL